MLVKFKFKTPNLESFKYFFLAACTHHGNPGQLK